MTHTYFLKIIGHIAAGVTLTAALAFILAAPRSSEAANYAFVNRSGEVSMVVANDPQTALMTAYNIAIHSGVILLDSADDNALLGGRVSGF